MEAFWFSLDRHDMHHPSVLGAGQGLRIYSSISGAPTAMWWREGRALAVSALHLSTTLVLAWSPSIGIRTAAESSRVWFVADIGRRAQHGGSGSKPSRWSKRRSSSALASAVEAKVQSVPL